MVTYIETAKQSLVLFNTVQGLLTVSTPVHREIAQPISSPRLFHSMNVSQYDHVVPYTDLGGRWYFGVLRCSCFRLAISEFIWHSCRGNTYFNNPDINRQLLFQVLHNINRSHIIQKWVDVMQKKGIITKMGVLNLMMQFNMITTPQA